MDPRIVDRREAVLPALKVELWIPRRAPNLNDLFRAKATLYGKRGANGYAALKKSWEQTVFLCTRAAMTPRLRRCSIHFEFVEANRRRDPDNLCVKPILDGLVKAGVLEGDGWAHIAALSFSWRVGSPAGVRVVLSPVAAVTQKEVGMNQNRVNGGTDGQ